MSSATTESLARRMYGRRGCVGALRHDCDTVTRQGRVTGSTYEAFIGRAPTEYERRHYAMNGVTGRNVWIYV